MLVSAASHVLLAVPDVKVQSSRCIRTRYGIERLVLTYIRPSARTCRAACIGAMGPARGLGGAGQQRLLGERGER